MQLTTVAANNLKALPRWIRVITLQVAQEIEARVTGKVEGGPIVDQEEAGAGLAEADFSTWSKIGLKLQEQFCRKVEKI